ncbi:FlgB family protein [Gemmobacter aquaticus]|nr:FlgB family protein [Gemmobacter aquaticus]
MTQGFARHAGARQAEIARNMAHADTPGFKARDMPPFAEVYGAAQGQGMLATRPGHLGSAKGPEGAAVARVDGSAASPDGNTVSIEREMVRAAEVRQDHAMALSIYQSVSNILRGSLGKAR